MRDKKTMQNNKKNKLIFHDLLKGFFLYSLIFIAIVTLLLIIFNHQGKSLLWKSDGLNQHIITLQYFKNILTEFLHTGHLSTFTWNLNLGIDMFSNLAYYIIGDIFSYFVIFVPDSSIESFYGILVLARIYFVGISFLCFAKYKKMNTFSSSIGALLYTFSYYVLYASPRHPYFTNALILFPLILIGLEKSINEDQHLFYTIMLALTFISSFYFAYMMSLIIAIYGLILAITTYKKEGIKKITTVLGKTLFYSLLAIMISGIILVPSGIGFLTSERSMITTIFPYSLAYYQSMLINILAFSSNGYWLCWGFSSIILISLPIFIRKRSEHYPLFLTMCILLIPLLIPQIGSIFCGFNYPNNRWSYVMTFIFAYITAIFINNNCQIAKSDLKTIIIVSAIYFGLIIFFNPPVSKYVYVQMFIALAILILILLKKYIKKFPKWFFNVSLIGIITINIFASLIVVYKPKGYGAEFLDKGTLTNIYDTSYNTISDFKQATDYLKFSDKSFYRISKNPYVLDNVSLINDFLTPGGYYSLTPEVYGNLNIDLENSSYYTNYGARDFDNRTKINNLLGVKYLVSSLSTTKVPYGYEKISDYSGPSQIYQNKYALTFATLYSNYIKKSDYEALSSLEKESALLKTVVLNNNTDLPYNSNLDLKNIQKLDYQIINESNVFQNNIIRIKSKKKNYLKLNIANIENSEIYISFKNLEFTPRSKEEIINSKIKNITNKVEKSKIKNNYRWYTPSTGYNLTVKYNNLTKTRNIKTKTSAYYMDINDFLFNLGYYEKTNGEIKITFSSLGTYTFDDISVYAVSMDDYKSDIENLKKANFELLDYGKNYLSGTVLCESSGILQFATNYNTGWNIYIDDVKVDSLKVNNYFLGVGITKGSHEIKIIYHNPYLKYGLILSMVGIGTLVTVTFIKINKSKNKTKSCKV